VFFAPGEVHLSRLARGWRPQPAQGLSVECATAGAHAWDAALDALAGALSRLGWQGADARVTLSNHFVRFALVRGAGKLSGEVERVAAARHALRATYGERGEGWQAILGEATAGPAVAAAVEPALIEGLASTLLSARLRPAAIEPFLASAFNACRGSIGRDPVWLAVTEPGRACLAHFDGGAWRQVRNERLRAGLEAELPAALERCRLAGGVDAGARRVLLVSRGDPRVDPASANGWSFERVRLDGADLAPLAA
jgi:hypothetical protein